MNKQTLRVLWTVQGPGTGALLVASATLAFGAYIAWLDPLSLEQMVPIMLFLQLFAAATGYRDRLRRGHFDPVLVGRVNRWPVALAHWTASVGLGLLVWTLIGLLALALGGSHRPTAFTAAGWGVLLYVSTVAWMATLVLPRFSGAVLWLLLLLGLSATQYLVGLRVAFNPSATAAVDVLRAVGSSLILPVFLLLDPAAVSVQVLVVMFLVTLAIATAGAAIICRLDACLVDS